MEIIVDARDVSIEFHTRTALVPAVRGVSFKLHKGETYGLVGESGCGKSTMAYATMGYVAGNGRFAGGQILYKGQDLASAQRSELRRIWGQGIAMVYQDPSSHLNPSMRIGDQIAEMFGAVKRKESWIWDKVIVLLESVRITDPMRIARSYPHQLSGGMLQRVCIAMALARDSDLLIMDEPTTALDVTTEAVILDLVTTLKEEHHIAILYITHDLGVVARICDRVGVMYMGRLVEEAEVCDLFHSPRHPYTRCLLRCVPKLGETKASTRIEPIPGSVGRPENTPDGCAFAVRCHSKQVDCDRSEPLLREVTPGHYTSCDCPPKIAGVQPIRVKSSISKRTNESTSPLLQARGLRYYFAIREGFFQGLWGRPQQVKAVDGVSFQVGRQKTLSIVGESGCGKSTLARLVIGLLAPQEGQLSFGDVDIAKTVRQRPMDILSRMAIVFQNPDTTLNPKHTIGYTLISALKAQKRDDKSKQWLSQEATRYLKMVNLEEHYFTRYPHQLSGGEKQRVAVARALASNPDLVVCDEPTSALDVSVQAAILKLLLELQEQLTLSYIMISHDLSVVHYISDQIAVMYLGQICEIGSTQEVFAPPYHPYTEALLSAIPLPDPTARQRNLRLTGPVPSMVSPPTGCRFHTRCPRQLGDMCKHRTPIEHASPTGHRIWCHIPWDELTRVSPPITFGESDQ